MQDDYKKLFSGISVIKEYALQYKKEIVDLSIFGILLAIIGGVDPYVFGKLIDSIASQETLFAGSTVAMPLFVGFIILWGSVQLTSHIVEWQNSKKTERMAL